MAASTGTLTVVHQEASGRLGKKLYCKLNLSGVGADGYPLNASDLGYNSIVWFSGSQAFEDATKAGYRLGYVPDAEPDQGEAMGDGDLFVYEAGADAAPLDEVETGDLGVFYFELVVR